MWEFFSIVSEFVKMTHFRTIDCMEKKKYVLIQGYKDIL